MLVAEEKKCLRRQMNELLHNLPVAETAAGSSVICKTLGQLPDYHKARRIMAFLSMTGEVDLDAFIEKALADDKEVYVPRCLDKGNMEGVRLYDLGQTVFDRYGIRTAPEGAPTCTADVPDLLIISGLAFDKNGCRLGRGAGFYDRFIAGARASQVVAVAFAAQIVEYVPTEPHDQTVCRIVTEKEIIHVS